METMTKAVTDINKNVLNKALCVILLLYITNYIL